MRNLDSNAQLRLDGLYRHLCHRKRTYLGYPNSALLDNTNLSKFLDIAINNVGDPFLGNNGMHTCELEREVLAFFARILNIEESSMWGYITNGGTESNTYGLFLGREAFPTGIVYYSEDTHYSVPKAVRLLNLRDAVIRSQENGEMDYEHLKSTLVTLRRYPAIINVNIGTTMKGAIDSVAKVLEALSSAGIQKYYIHCDAALFGGMLPFMSGAPVFDFRLPIGSVAISGHKFLGSPIPCGILIARKDLVERVRGNVEYIGSHDSTLSGSRDGFSVLVLWQTIQRYGVDGLRELVLKCMEETQTTVNKLKKINWPAWSNSYSNIVVIKRPEEELIRKWQLATEKLISHLILMPGVTQEMIDAFLDDLQSSRFSEERALKMASKF